MAKVTMPQLGESVAEGTIGKWLKQPGDTVAKDEPLLEVITDKVNAEVPSPFEGVLREILVEEGQTVPYDAEIAEIEEAGGAAAATPRGAGTAAAKAAAPAAAAGAAPASARRPTPPERRAAPPARGTARRCRRTRSRAARPRPASPVMAVGDPDARMTPAVRMLMREHGLTPPRSSGTGHGGRITRDDVTGFVEQPSAAGGNRATGRGAATAAGQAAVSPSVPPAPVLGVASHSPGLAPSVPSRRAVRSPGSRARTRSSSRTPRCAAASPPR